MINDKTIKSGWTIESLIEDLKKEPGKAITTRDGRAMVVHTTLKARYPGFDVQWFNAPGFKDKFKALGGGVGKDSAGEWSIINLWTSQVPVQPVVEQKPAAPDITIIPPEVIALLKPSQIPAVAHLVQVLKERGHALDASGTGTGKTYMGCAAAKTLGLKVVVIGPKNSLPKWRQILELFKVDVIALSNYDLARLAKMPVRRASARAKTGFVIEHKDAPFLKIGSQIGQSRFTWSLPENALVILDEAHKCKNKSAINTELLLAATNQNIKTLLLSATIGESPMKLYAIAHNLGFYPQPKNFYTWARGYGCDYVEIHTKSRTITTFDFVGSKADLVRLHEAIFPAHGIRLRPEDIPEFPQTLILAEVVDMNSNAAKIQTAYLKMQAELEKLRQAKAKDGDSELTIRLRARQEIELLKTPTLVEMAEDLVDSNNAVVIFVNFSDTVRALMKELKTDCVIWGEQSGDEREKNRQAFQDDKQHVIICNLASGGQSIDLHDTHGNFPRVSLITPSDSAQDVKQALGRIQRMGGMTKSVQKIIFCADTVEELVAENVQKKIENIDALNDGDLTGIAATTNQPSRFVDVFCTKCGSRVPEAIAEKNNGLCPTCLAASIKVNMVCIKCRAIISEETAVKYEMLCEKCFAQTEPPEDELKKMPSPRVELEDGIYQKEGVIYKVIMAIYGSGHKYAKKLVQKSDGSWHFVFESKAISLLTPEDRMTLENAKAFGKLYGICCSCSRQLTDEDSIEHGMGPICRGKFK
jgi:superfamily II DNA or RNA helicase